MREINGFGRLIVSLAVLVVLTGGCTSAEKKASASLDRALKLHQDGKLDAAKAAYRDVLESDPHNKYADYNLGLIAQTQGDASEAVAHYRKALAEDPNFIPVLYNMAILSTDAGDREEAKGFYKTVIRLAPDDASAHLNLGFLLLDMGKTKDGNAEIAKAIALDPSLSSRVPKKEDADPNSSPVPAV